MRKTSKENRATKASINCMLQAEAATAIKAPPVITFSARMLAYTYTRLCPDPGMRKALVLKLKAGGDKSGSGKESKRGKKRLFKIL